MADIPYRNLVLTGCMGAGKRSAGRVIAARLDAPLIDIESEVEAQEGHTVQEIRQLFGQTRARALVQEVCRDLDLRRHAIIVAAGAVLLNPANRRLEANAEMLCLACDLNEILRRMYAAMGARFHDLAERARIVAHIKRERPVCDLGYPELDTTYLSADQVADRAIAYWRRGPEGLKPPAPARNAP